MKRILITGGAGFIGERLASALAAEGHPLDILDDLSRGSDDQALKALLQNGRVRFVQADLLSAEQTASLSDRYEMIVHLAAILGVRQVSERPFDTLRNNVLMHEAVIRLAQRQKNLKRLAFASTSEIYAGSQLYLKMPVPTPENTPVALTPLEQPRTSYMLSKLYGEAMVIHSGLPYTIFRPHNVYGPRMGLSHVIPQLLHKAHDAKAGGTMEVFSASHRRCFCFIDDAIEMLTRTLFSKQALGQQLNLGSQHEEVTMRRLAQIVIATVGKPLKIKVGAVTPGSPSRRVPDMTRMRRIAGYSAKISLEEGVARTYEWYRSHVFKPGLAKRP